MWWDLHEQQRKTLVKAQAFPEDGEYAYELLDEISSDKETRKHERKEKEEQSQQYVDMLRKQKEDLIEQNKDEIRRRRVLQGLPPDETLEEIAEKARKKEEAQKRLHQMQEQQQQRQMEARQKEV